MVSLELCSTQPLAVESSLPSGLVFHLDPAAQAKARRANSLPAVASRQPVDFVFDTAPSGRASFQPQLQCRPLLVADADAAYFEFDGQNDFLLFNSVHAPVREFTLFILAAPLTNHGSFSGFFSAAQQGKNDYTSGCNLDLGPFATKELSVLNAEAAGAPGFQDLLVPGFLNATERSFGDFHAFTIRSRPGPHGHELFLDGFRGGVRSRTNSVIGLDQVVVGARIYSNQADSGPFVQGFLRAAIAEVQLYRRALSDEERQAVEKSLLAKTVPLHALLRGTKGHPLEVVPDPPPIQMLVPGFTVEELPLKIGNLNNLRYRYDGKLVGLGYDGRIHLLSDRDGDGLEDTDELFWDKQTLRGPIGIALTDQTDPPGDGVFVSSKGKVSLILDRDRDGRADEERIIATGWPESFHSVDTLGLALDRTDGSIYFGLGCANFADAYLIDKTTGRAQFDLRDIRGTIQKLSPDFSKQETICTGVRFTCSLAFNRAGDLFATDQEGATWLPNGNPLDELLHIQPGKHYGFPPRHPKHLPTVRDEPAVIEFGPQHQSTVGMVFNEGVNGGPPFGPQEWAGDAIVCGESRGKIWRTKLAKTPLGYVAQNHLIACLTMLTIDACVSPRGDLTVACHSGPPDWGTGPAGQGRLFKIRYSGPTLPQPLFAWASAPDEFRIAFNHRLDPADWANAKDQVKIEAGPYVRPGDRFEIMRPGYQVVRDQLALPRRWIDVLSLTFTEDARTLVIRVPRQTEPVSYAITLPSPNSWKQPGGLAQHPQIDLAVTLNGLTARLIEPNAQALRTVLPHPSLAASAILTAGSAEHEKFLRLAAKPEAVLSLGGSIDVANPFVPAVQPGSTLDWDLTEDPFTSARFALRIDYQTERELPLRFPDNFAWAALESGEIPNPSTTANGLFLNHQNIRHPIATPRLYLPWANPKSSAAKPALLARDRTDVQGNWLEGRRLFFGEAGCVTCHTLRGEGIPFGPDLSNLIHRDRESVLQDILSPSATINPDRTGTLLTFKDGTSLSGIIHSLRQDRVELRLPAGAQIEIDRSQLAALEPLKISLMPAGFGDLLNNPQLEDLLTFLLLNPLEPGALTRTDPPPPPPRSLSEVVDVIGLAYTARQNHFSPLRVLLCAGPKDHGVDEHDYPLWLERWSRLLALGEAVTVRTAMGFAGVNELAWADVAVFYNANPDWSREKAAALDSYHARGGGAVYIHYANNGGNDPDGVSQRIGLAFIAGSRFRHGEFDLVFQRPDHPITRGLPALHFTDETYWKMKGETSRLDVLASAVEEGSLQPQLWAFEREKSRIVGCIPGHYTWTFDDPLFRVLVLRSICWAAKEADVDRLAELSLVGARFTDARSR